MGERLLVRYQFPATSEQAPARALGIALEQSTELPAGAEPARIHALGLPGRVEALAELPDQPGIWEAVISLPADLVTAGDPGALLNVLFGNTSLQPDVTLVDADLGESVLDSYPGPRSGIDGVRALVGAPTGPLTCTALKPVGLAPDDLAALAGRFARAGIHLIKDDHGIVDQAYAPFAQRVAACQRAVDEANAATGLRAVYAPHLTGTLTRLRERLEIAHRSGVRGIMVAPMLVGLPAFCEIAGDAAERGMIVLAHPAFSGAARMAPDLLLGSLFRICGADAVIFVNHGGRFGTPPATCRALAHNLRRPWGALRPALPVPAGGMTPDRVPEMVDFYGQDVLLLVSGALYPADEGLDDRARVFVAAAQTKEVFRA